VIIMTTLPIESTIPELMNVLRSHTNVVLVAPPGAGKTTRVPLALLDEPWLAQRRILMLEPRRLAARSAARFMAKALGEQVGETVGYRVRMETRVGPKTRIEVITEGVLTRLLQADPALEDVGIIIFDEFHERSLHTDLGLALSLQSQAILRDDLRIVIMSATLDAQPVAELLGHAPIIHSKGYSYPVETRYLPRPVDRGLEQVIVRTVLHALENDQGDILVFLPGAGEIRRIEHKLKELPLGEHIRIAPLYGALPQEAQDLAIAPSVPGERKVVLATSIAETSLTVEGVQVVIDSGLMRVSRYSPRTGMTRLETVPVSQASADQRRGRAGRLAPGVCYRLWTEQENSRLAQRNTPEMLVSDLVPLALELALWGVSDPSELPWLDPPPKSAFAQARNLLFQLMALSGDGSVTAHGRQMAELGVHPRLAHMILRAIPLGLGELACELAAILSERDFIRGDRSAPPVDVSLRVEALRQTDKDGRSGLKAGAGYTVDAVSARRIQAEANHLKERLGIMSQGVREIDACGLLLAFAFPERIAQSKGGGRFLLSNGRGAFIADQQPLGNEPYLVAAELDDQGPESRILLAAAVDWEDLKRHLHDQIEQEQRIEWDRSAQAIRARQRERLGALVLKETPLPNPEPEASLAALLHGIAVEGLEILPWTRTARQLQQRLLFIHHQEQGWPDVSDEALASTVSSCLAPYLHGMKSRDDLQRLNLVDILHAQLTWDQRRELDECAPTHIVVPSGSRIPVDYSDPASPVLAVRLQELFGLKETPRIARGKVPLTLHLLSPAHRPVQVTRDLASFWQTAYFDVKKDLKGRYPKHFWPDDPLQAMPTNRTKPKRN
jgi:ATP-dependent helicase HrpB